MENRDLPFGLRLRERVLQPGGLSLIKVVRIEHEKFGQTVPALKLVVGTAAHIEKRILALILPSGVNVVIAQYRVKVDAIFQQARKRCFKVFSKIPPAAVGVNVV